MNKYYFLYKKHIFLNIYFAILCAMMAAKLLKN